MPKKSSSSDAEENIEKEIPSEADTSEKVGTAAESSALTESTETVSAEEQSIEEPSAETVSMEESFSAENHSGGSNLSESAKVETRYGLTRFLQLNPQSFYVESLLRSQCVGDVMTKAWWFEKINAILNKKMQ